MKLKPYSRLVVGLFFIFKCRILFLIKIKIYQK
nr:MAG TPA: hypothetical protein [Caudoviricetes sp.]